MPFATLSLIDPRKNIIQARVNFYFMFEFPSRITLRTGNCTLLVRWFKWRLNQFYHDFE